MNTVYIRGLALGEGRPKICIPIVGKTKEEILKEAEKVRELPADIVEWRGDWYEDIFSGERLTDMLTALRGALGELPLLFTFRSIQEGGENLSGRSSIWIFTGTSAVRRVWMRWMWSFFWMQRFQKQ